MRPPDRVKRLLPVVTVTTTALTLVASAGWGQHLNAPGTEAPAPATAPVAPTYSDNLVVGPHTPVPVHSDVEVDLRARVLRLDPTLTVRLPDDLVLGGFRDHDTFVDQFAPEDRAYQRSLLLQDDFEGSVFHVWGSTASSTRYSIDLQRFQEPAGATQRLGEFVNGSLHMAAGARPTRSSVPDGLAFLDREPEVQGHYRQLVQYFARGRYFGYVRVLVKDDVTIHELRQVSERVTRAQYARTEGRPPGSTDA